MLPFERTFDVPATPALDVMTDRGKIEIEYYSMDDLDRIFQTLIKQ